MEQNRNRIAPEAATDEPASPVNRGDSYFSPPAQEEHPPRSEKATVPPPPPPLSPLLTDFDPVPLRFRYDGLTPQRQREFVEALADCGLAREAAARIGVSEQAVARVRRRADARAFDLACEAAQRLGARRIRSVAYERAIEGTVKRHYYHGELKSEEVVYDNRLLIYLLGKTAHLAEPPAEAQQVIDDWEPWMAAIEQGLAAPPEPEPEEASEAGEDEAEEEAFDVDGDAVWQDEDGVWWTRFPPAADFFGSEEGVPGDEDYQRTLSAAELEAVEAQDEEDHEARLERACARRDAWFGFRGARFGEESRPEAAARRKDSAADAAALAVWAAERKRLGAAAAGEVFPAREAETNETSVQLEGTNDDGDADDPPDQRDRGPRITML